MKRFWGVSIEEGSIKLPVLVVMKDVLPFVAFLKNEKSSKKRNS